ncbi:hypothetical protein PHYSODRAFT_250293 [Phytophthora sojae]|uniref:Amino acid transporter transmembrane domain-containing protein n=1 Tax=Phytophthora sojae (strain P6497) TaxID=1094619 RepID=G4Z153_PHYSP|nr:hypothetical protein PHYSODRAFT_250293 [Phytophthora sojae]EGZ24054.1 hypothetical protein PHYSODRAFT_250293 [Phytophthora sojae]|eukprot:XP_009519342.1 hypothetical protein PHYSODRAFT_250293 [Phytophthora sojae]
MPDNFSRVGPVLVTICMTSTVFTNLYAVVAIYCVMLLSSTGIKTSSDQDAWCMDNGCACAGCSGVFIPDIIGVAVIMYGMRGHPIPPSPELKFLLTADMFGKLRRGR